MRCIAKPKTNDAQIKRLMIHSSSDGIYLFEYDIIEDGSSIADTWFESLDAAFSYCKDDYGVEKDDWQEISDPHEDCQQDWISPVRVLGRDKGDPQWGQFEKLVDGKWIKIIKG